MTKSDAPQSDPRCFVALDLPSVAEAEAMVEILGDAIESYKIGLQLLPIGGVELGQRLKAKGKNIFYDFKFGCKDTYLCINYPNRTFLV